MFNRDELPDDAADWRSIEVQLEDLPEGLDSCPYPLDDVFDYIIQESGDGDLASRDRLVFLRAAKLKDSRAWIWSYCELDGSSCYVHCSQGANGGTSLGIAESNGLSPAQFMLAEYYDEVYWS